MTYYKTTRIVCDGEDCYEEYDVGVPTATGTREYAKGEGWTNEGSEDYCSECSQ